MASVYVWDVAERAVKTAAQTASAFLVGDGLGLLDVDWGQVGSVAGLALVASVVTSIATKGFGRDNGTASVLSSVRATE